MKFWHIDSPQVNDPRRVAMFLGEAEGNPRQGFPRDGLIYRGFWKRIVIPASSLGGSYAMRGQSLMVSTGALIRDSSRSCARGAP